MPQKQHLLLREGNYPAAQPQVVLGRLYLRSREVRGQGGRITMDEIEDAVTSWVHSGNQIAPGDRALWVDGILQWYKTAARGKRGKVGHFPSVHETLQQLWIHTVDTQNEELLFLCGRLRAVLARKRQAQQGAE